MSPEKALIASNSRLKAGGIDLSIEIKKNHLCLRGMLPPKPGSDRTANYDQRIYLSYPPLVDGIKQAEKDALAIRVSLIEKRFDWCDWSNKLKHERDNPIDMSIGAITTRMEEDYFTRRARTIQSEATWDCEYAYVYKRLPQGEQLSKAVIMALIATTAPETRIRQRYVQSLSNLAKFAGLEIDIMGYGRGYTPSKVELRELPTDADIELYHKLIPTPSWQNAYALIATFGLRPHEIMHLDLSSLPVLDVLGETKTGARRIRGLNPQWVEQFGISADMELPKITTPKNRAIGSQVTHQFKRYGIPSPPL
jgi:hypothetical protein